MLWQWESWLTPKSTFSIDWLVPGGGLELEPLLRAFEPAGEILSEQRESKDLYLPESIRKSWCREGESNPQGPKPGGF
jgi:hypothetical protein